MPSDLTATPRGGIARVEKVTRCLPEVQDALVSLLSERRIAIAALSGSDDALAHAAPGFDLIATANLRDKGVSEMSAALKRRFDFETVGPIPDLDAETALVRSQARASVERAGVPFQVDEAVLDALVIAYRDLREVRTGEGCEVGRPSTVVSTAEAVSVAGALGSAAACFPGDRDVLGLLLGYLLGVVRKDDSTDAARLRGYWDGPVRRRAEQVSATWRPLWDLRTVLAGPSCPPPNAVDRATPSRSARRAEQTAVVSDDLVGGRRT